MKANISPEDLILYIYKETSLEQTLCIERALQEDWTLMEKFRVLRAAVKRLDELKQSPRTEAVLNILHYANQKNAEISTTFKENTKNWQPITFWFLPYTGTLSFTSSSTLKLPRQLLQDIFSSVRSAIFLQEKADSH